MYILTPLYMYINVAYVYEVYRYMLNMHKTFRISNVYNYIYVLYMYACMFIYKYTHLLYHIYIFYLNVKIKKNCLIKKSCLGIVIICYEKIFQVSSKI